MVKGLIGPVGWEDQVRRYVPAAVFELLEARAG
jgi:pantetheine-phosphate adenylyltransferase